MWALLRSDLKGKIASEITDTSCQLISQGGGRTVPLKYSVKL